MFGHIICRDFLETLRLPSASAFIPTVWQTAAELTGRKRLYLTVTIMILPLLVMTSVCPVCVFAIRSLAISATSPSYFQPPLFLEAVASQRVLRPRRYDVKSGSIRRCVTPRKRLQQRFLKGSVYMHAFMMLINTSSLPHLNSVERNDTSGSKKTKY